MAQRRLSRDDLDFETCCYVCDAGNASGLHISYFLDEEARRVVADYRPQPTHEGAPGAVHGGVLGAVLDDAMAWAVNTLTGSFGLTRRAEIEFSRIVRAGRRYAVTAWIEETGEGRATTAAEMRDAQGRVCSSMRGQFALISREEARALFARRGGTPDEGG